MQELCHATRYVRTSSNPMGGILIKFFPHLNFGVVFFMCFLFFCVYPIFVLIFFVCFFVLYFLVVLFVVVVVFC